MTLHYNRQSEREKRKQLRRDQTPAEALVWRYLRNRQMLKYKFRRQYSIDKFILDFYSPELRLAIEIDGDVHDLPEQKQHDIDRQEYLEKFAIKFIRIKNEELFGNPDKAFNKIEKEIIQLSSKK
jgi:very-short-patch-repair endonuclease